MSDDGTPLQSALHYATLQLVSVLSQISLGERVMFKSLVACFVLAFPIAAFAQDLDKNLRAQIEAYLNKRPERQFQVEVSPDAPVIIPDAARENLRFNFQKRMALSGHGVLFDIDGNRVTLSDDEALAIQDELLTALRQDERVAENLPQEADAGFSELAKELAAQADAEQDGLRRAVLRHLEIRARAWRLEDEWRSEYLWRADYILNKNILRDSRIEILRDFDVNFGRIGRLIDLILGRTAYMGDCDRGGVPVPPDFSTAGSGWTFQGNLTTNMHSAGSAAQVWTWAHPSRRGVCVALPRGSGAPGDGAGIICQGSASGNACFWDNIDRTTGARIAWAGATLDISELQDGTMLAENCTHCHKGNNVFLVAPDDPT